MLILNQIKSELLGKLKLNETFDWKIKKKENV